MKQVPRSIIGKGFWVLRYRPLSVVSIMRGYFLFFATGLVARLFHFSPRGTTGGVRLGRNVRLQRLRCLQAERPRARVAIGDHSVVYEKALVNAYGTSDITIGECAVLGDIRIESRHGIKIGKRFISSWNVFIQDFDPHPVDPVERGKQVAAICASFRPRFSATAGPDCYDWSFPGSPISIGDDCWMGANTTVLKGARIGDGCIIATGAVVLAGEYPSRSLIAGNPAKVIKTV